MSDDEDGALLGLDAGQHSEDPVEHHADVGGEEEAAAPSDGASDSSDSDDDGGEANGENTADDDATAKAIMAALAEDDPSAAAAGATSSAFAHITSKKEAKKTLSKSDYKLWKKAQGKSSKKKKSKKDKKDKKGKKSSSKKESSKKHKSSSSKRKSKRGDDDDASVASSANHEFDDEDDDNGGHHAGGRRTKRAAAKRAQETFAFEGEDLNRRLAQPGSSQKKTSQKNALEIEKRNCLQLVESMSAARLADQQARARGEAPLHRVQLIPKVRDAANRLHLHETLINSGFLIELGAWLVTGDELAPEDLRTAALDALELIPFEDAEGGKRVSRKKKNGEDVDDTDAYDGATKEDLKKTNLGYAANKLRQHPKETPRNRAKATYLLQRLSVAFNGGSAAAPAEVKKWQSQGESGILPPFAHVKSASEKFAEKQSRVDPTDPKSYLRVAPKRFQPSYVSGMFDYEFSKPRPTD